MSIKEKLIHKLGGYTEDERIIHKTEIVNKYEYSHRQIVELTACYEYDPTQEMPDRELHRWLAADLAEKMADNNLIEFSSRASMGSPDYRVWYAKVKVVQPVDMEVYNVVKRRYNE